MKYLFDHALDASVYCWADNLLLSKGEAYYNISEVFKKSPDNQFSGYNSFLSSQSQWVYDRSITGAQIPSGVYINSVFTPRGSGNLTLDFLQGQALFSATRNGVISGNYSAKEINLYATTEKEEELLFEKKNFKHLKHAPNWTGRAAKDRIVPAIFIKSNAGNNDTLCFEGLSETEVAVRMVFICDNVYLYKGVTSLFRDAKETFFPILAQSQLPFDYRGDLKTGSWNYNDYRTNPSPADLAYVSDVRITNFTEQVNSLIGDNVIGAFIDCKISNIRYPRV